MIQVIAIAALFSGAIFFLGRIVYRSFQVKSGCATGCGKCGAIDFNKIEKQIKSSSVQL
jgi:hypothetical protein